MTDIPARGRTVHDTCRPASRADAAGGTRPHRVSAEVSMRLPVVATTAESARAEATTRPDRGPARPGLARTSAGAGHRAAGHRAADRH